MGYYGNLDTAKSIQALAEAFAAHTPEGIAATGEAVREQLRLTDEEVAKRDAALQTISDAAEATNSLQLERNRLSGLKDTLENAQTSITTREQGLDDRILVLNQKEKDLNGTAAAQATEATRLTNLGTTLDTRASQVADREAAVTEREQAVMAREKRITDAIEARI